VLFSFARDTRRKLDRLRAIEDFPESCYFRLKHSATPAQSLNKVATETTRMQVYEVIPRRKSAFERTHELALIAGLNWYTKELLSFELPGTANTC
jgi:hypothetical protein